MSSVDEKATSHASRRPHDAEASRRALLEAASELFEERGFEGATTREIGARAGVDPALIARYFGSKEALYLAVLTHAERPAPPADPAQAIADMVSRGEKHAMGPIGLAMVSPTLPQPLREQVRALVAERAVEPLTRAFEAAGCGDARLRAELLVALAMGASLVRAAGTLETLSQARLEEILTLLRPVGAALEHI